MLFCQEFKKPAGIFRYKNQSGIETNPITNDDEIIGWQAKFCDAKLSDHKSELIGMVVKSKRNYPDLTKIIFYTNQEWGQGKKDSDPVAKKEVEHTKYFRSYTTVRAEHHNLSVPVRIYSGGNCSLIIIKKSIETNAFQRSRLTVLIRISSGD